MQQTQKRNLPFTNSTEKEQVVSTPVNAQNGRERHHPHADLWGTRGRGRLKGPPLVACQLSNPIDPDGLVSVSDNILKIS